MIALNNLKNLKKSKYAVALLFVLLVILGMVWFKSEEAAKKAKNIYYLKIGTVLADNDPIVAGLELMAKKVESDTDGNVIIEVYASSELGDPVDLLKKAKDGANVGIILDTGALAEYVPDMGIYSAPYVFSSLANARKFIETPIFKKWDDELAALGLRDLSCNWYQGTRNFISNKKIERLSDLEGLSVRTMESAVARYGMRAFGAAPTSLPWVYVYSGLKNKTIDAVEVQAAAAYGASLYKVAKYCAVTEHFLLYTSLVVSESWFQSLPDEYKASLLARSKESGDFATKLTLTREADFNNDMRNKGMVFIKVDKKPFIKASHALYKHMNWHDLKAQIDSALGQNPWDSPTIERLF
ncbi:ABC transporter substrate-binding protein [Synergistales bacterium]|nr:ABC transporter substrate-binding protein [Synergistales bacterium]